MARVGRPSRRASQISVGTKTKTITKASAKTRALSWRAWSGRSVTRKTTASTAISPHWRFGGSRKRGSGTRTSAASSAGMT